MYTTALQTPKTFANHKRPLQISNAFADTFSESQELCQTSSQTLNTLQTPKTFVDPKINCKLYDICRLQSNIIFSLQYIHSFKHIQNDRLLFRRMFWADWGKTPKIEVSSLDGSGRRTIVSTDLVWPNGLTIDRGLEKLYWADAKLDRIEYANLDGTQRRILVSEFIPHIFSLSLLGRLFIVI